MRRCVWISAVVLALFAALVPSVSAQAAGERGAVPLPLERLFDNMAVSDDTRPTAANFDGSGASLSAQDLAAAGWTAGRALTVQGARLTWPNRQPGEPDNVLAAGQDVRMRGHGDALAFLVAGTAGVDVGGAGTVLYADGARSAYHLTASDWRTGPLATKAVALPHINTPGGQLAERARLYVVTVPLLPGREVAAVRLPQATGLHVFAVAVRAPAPGWTGSWATATGGYPTVGPWTDRTLRLVVHTSVGGPRVRLRFDNTFAAGPVRIGGATVAVQRAGAAAKSTPARVSFRGAAGVEIPAGAQAYSDPLGFAVPADANLLVSFHLPGTVPAAPVHRLAQQRSYVSGPGDHTADVSAAAYGTVLTSWPLLTGVDVGGGPGSVVLLGDSITDGDKSTVDANRRWPDVLATRLLKQSVVPRYGVLNQGISGNRVVSDRYPGDGVSTDTAGVSALYRFDRDVVAQTSVRTAVVFEGINDVRWGTTSEQVIAGLRAIADRGHARGLRMLAATILPCEGEARCTAAVDAERSAVNAWIRGAGVFDGVLDFDTVVRDPARPSRMLPAYDSGDHLHPGDAGLAALAESVDLRVLVP
ncbi:SGNH/GDSL hydrolase family protein [Streptomyces ferrugineus]|uniref:SGNH/GDSL hydrolase family protein n=1 Tax=Streptomyces ferrugineus TaxID=1413221 RepID=A0A7M2SE02_9ACTN|nr:SGNH/GDSL hydrolase family protein [Streptomyces ferrugineus]QOV34560.1 SGNH/GDSL hydrolase family protein [Streptomyces ferrugineus]